MDLLVRAWSTQHLDSRRNKWLPLVPSARTKSKSESSNTNGREYAALGATVVRRDISGYVKFKCGHYWLTRWSGGTMLDCRSEVVEQVLEWGLGPDVSTAQGRFIVGYVIDGDGSLFRGELIDHCDEDEARRHCVMVANNWAEVDAEDEEAELAEV